MAQKTLLNNTGTTDLVVTVCLSLIVLINNNTFYFIGSLQRPQEHLIMQV